MHLLLLLTLAATDGGTLTPDAGHADAGWDRAHPVTWALRTRLPKGGAERARLVAELTSDAGSEPGAVGESPLTPAEAEALLDDDRAQLVYGEKTISIVAPSMAVRHRQEHLDLMKLFLTPERLAAGNDFSTKYDEPFRKAEARYGVPREAIIAILMWESKLGTITGDWQVFNVFVSQAYFVEAANELALQKDDEKKLVADPAKQQRKVAAIRERAHKNLLALARQCKTRGIDPLTVKGSWAGALGFPQFMPASLRWAVDGNDDGVIDLFTFDDALFSVARYLAEHGWQQSPKGAVWGYNHEDAYVQGVLAYADALHALRSPDGGQPDAGSVRAAPAKAPAGDGGVAAPTKKKHPRHRAPR